MTAAGGSPLERLYRLAPRGALLGLERMRAACATMGHPERAFASLHIAGTNGKGSVAAMLASMARAHRVRVGLYTSPHLCEFRERIQIDGEPAGSDELAANLDEVLTVCPELTFFEAATLTAFLTLARRNVALGVIEVGLGGRLDATNVLEAQLATGITRIALDHADRLGSDLVSIAREKAGILRHGVPAVIGPLDAGPLAEVLAIAATRGAPVVATSEDAELAAFVARHPPALGGAHQIDNAKIAVAMARRAALSDAAIAEGLRLVRWPGRLESVHTPRGEVLLDAAHNPDGALALAAALKARGRDAREVALVFGALADKDYAGMLGLLAPHAAHRVYVAPEGRRPADLAALVALAEGSATSSVPEALERGRSAVGTAGLVVVTGSIFLVGAARAHLFGLPRDPAIAL